LTSHKITLSTTLMMSEVISGKQREKPDRSIAMSPASEDDVTVSDRTLREWLEWAKAKAEALNPFGAGAAGMFQTIAR
jgi:hypothetical protein